MIKQNSNRRYIIFRRTPLFSGLGLLLVLAAGLGLANTIARADNTPDFSLDERIACQTAVEAVYWQNREWPAFNPDSKPPLTAVMPAEAIAAKAMEGVLHTNALAAHWGYEITGEMLQAEMNRQAAQTKNPEMLHSLWQALDHDPAMIAECLARPALAKRLLQNWQAQDERFAHTDFASWWAEVQADLPRVMAPVSYEYTLPALTEGVLQDDTWDDTAAIPLSPEGQSVWTGTEMIFLGEFSTQGHRYDPVLDTWETMTTVGTPLAVTEFTAVWSGTEMITWGGCNGGSEFCTTSAGGRYNPATNTWTPTSTSGAPVGRRFHGAVWSGTEMIVWGGCREDANGNQNCNIGLNSGGRYNPATDSWQATSLVNAPSARNRPELVWAGDQMILWSGTSAADPGRRYDPATDTWLNISQTNAPPARLAALVWTGSEMVAWGGCIGSPFCNSASSEGGRYDPAADTWTAVSSTGAPVGRWAHDAVWTGVEMIVWGGNNTGGFLNSGGRYNPLTDSWTPTSTTGAPSPRMAHTLWADGLMLVWGGIGSGSTRDGARYDPAVDSWTPISNKDPHSFRYFHRAVWTGAEMIAWGGLGDGTAASGLDTGRIYDPATDSWDATSMVNAPSPRDGHSAIWTGTEMIIWGGDVYSWFTRGTGGRYNPMTDTWTPTNEPDAPVAKAFHTAVWTGSEMIVWGGNIWNYPWDDSGSRYDPVTDSWVPLTGTGAPDGRYLHSGVWTGSEMLIWGGGGSTGPLGDGARYDPAMDTWQPITSTNAPTQRVLHSTVWDGTQMIVWGGISDFWTYLDSGSRYNPATDTWTAVTTTGAPTARARHTGIWTGDEMIIWSGCTIADCLWGDAAGGRYNPQTDSWQPTSQTGAPEARQWHTAVWTGDAMIVWGGNTDDNGITHTGGLYFADTSGNNAPQAHNDAYAVTAGETLTVTAPGILSNDTDPEADPLTAILVTEPDNGSLLLNGDGSFVYTPDGGFAGIDTFTYQASDGTVLSNIALVAIEVTNTNAAPTAVDDAFSLAEDTPVTVPAPGVLDNDFDPDGDPMTATLLVAPPHGALSFSVDGSFTYTPTLNFHGLVTFTYQALDGQAQSQPAAVALTVNPVNDAPEAMADGYQVALDTTLVITAPGVLANDSDVDGDSLTAAVTTLPTNGTLVLQADGSFTYTPHAGFTGIDSFVYEASDGQGGAATAVATIEVTGEVEPTYFIYLPLLTNP